MTYRIAAIDIHKNVLMVVVAIAAAEVADTAGEALEFICQRFGTGAEERRRLVRWLQQQEVTEVVMESTAQYWKPIWLELQPHLQKLHLAQAQARFSGRQTAGAAATGRRVETELRAGRGTAVVESDDADQTATGAGAGCDPESISQRDQ